MNFEPLNGPFGLILCGILGLLIGSFLNVVIHRLPRILEQRWAQECAELTGADTEADSAPLTLSRPRSHCPTCASPVRWHHNIPVLSFLVLRGRCADCGASIGWRYPLIELLTGALYVGVFMLHGANLITLVWLGFASALIALCFIDWDTTLLPDDITLPLIWSGLIVNQLSLGPVSLPEAMWGAVAGYLSLWLVYWVFKLVTGKEGMGYGDFKLFAALGAWFGWQALPPMILLASCLGALIGIALKYSDRLREGGYFPFGPFLAIAGVLALFVPPVTFYTWLTTS